MIEDYADEARLRADIAEPKHGAKPLARLADTLDRAGRVADHYGLPPEHALALVTPHASAAWRAKLAADTAIYEAMGGRVAEVAPGVSGIAEPVGNTDHPWRELWLTYGEGEGAQ